jgi:hypothetical protein
MDRIYQNWTNSVVVDFLKIGTVYIKISTVLTKIDTVYLNSMKKIKISYAPFFLPAEFLNSLYQVPRYTETEQYTTLNQLR